MGAAGIKKEPMDKNDKKWVMFKKPPPKIQECFIKFLTTEELKTLAEVGKPGDEILRKKAIKALRNCTKQNN